MKATVTYSPEDNKLRLYVGRVPRADYDALRAAGFVATPKQDCDFAATWTPTREDLAREFMEDGEDIGDEDYSPTERAADRAERFEGYREKRADEATGHADTFAAGPSAFGHQSQARAERQARRHDRHRIHAVSQWAKAEYWTERTAGVIAHALHRADPATRRGRILTLEAEQRKNEANRAEYAERFAAWSKVPTLDGADIPVVLADGAFYGVNVEATSRAGRLAYSLANSGGCWGEYTHPRKERPATSLYTLLTLTEDPITPAEAAALWLEGRRPPGDPESSSERWAAHYSLRLEYERAMLANEGGTAAEADMEPGGWIGSNQIHAINRSPVTKRVVSVKLMAPERWHRGPGPAPLTLQSFNIERLPEGSYRAPTDEERAAFKTATKERKAKEKASKPKEAPLINPTDADAERLQAMWNAAVKGEHDKSDRAKYTTCPVSEIVRMTQAEYSARSKGTYSSCETSTVTENLRVRRINSVDRAEVFKVRTCHGENYGARRIIILTDKPQKAIPWDDAEAEKKKHPAADQLFHRLEEIATAATTYSYNLTDEQRQLIDDARYVGWVWSSSQTQRGLTDAGKEAYERFRAIKAEGGTPTPTGTTYPLSAVAAARR